ncbi:hypothetical protein EMPS_10889 [Entomortierella parvispora]|uniref:Nucleoside phosphorylase domain-containing protein n=1 Tax=Entomortierella parvispora TaxID=205924 RepID=A0A9P3HL12_9FUNG|nr:hypothetical protein EMPS_10889 [Entomortierella parvispora]
MSMTNANFPMDAEGRTYHVGVKRGELANRVITVGDPVRAMILARSLDGVDPATPAKSVPSNLFSLASHRGFLTITGRYKNVPVSIVAIGMGISMMDFFVRECRAVVDGPMLMIRLGSCGSLSDCKVGDICVPSSSFLVQRNVDYFSEDGDNGSPYHLSKSVAADPEITQVLVKNMSAALGEDHVWSGINATADSFYSSQGRQDENFLDENQELFTQLLAHEPKTLTLEMETFVLYHLARSSTQASLKKDSAYQKTNGSKNSIRAGACMMVFAQRKTNDFITKDDVARVEPLAGKGIFESLIQVSLGGNEELHSEEGSVWAMAREI